MSCSRPASPGCNLGADNARSTRPVIDHDLLTEDLADTGLDDTGDKIGCAAGRERHDHHDGSVGIGAEVLGGGCCAEQQAQCDAERLDSNPPCRCHG